MASFLMGLLKTTVIHGAVRLKFQLRIAHSLEEFSVQFNASLFDPTQLMAPDLTEPNPNSEEAPALGPFPSVASTGKRLHVE